MKKKELGVNERKTLTFMLLKNRSVFRTNETKSFLLLKSIPSFSMLSVI